MTLKTSSRYSSIVAPKAILLANCRPYTIHRKFLRIALIIQHDNMVCFLQQIENERWSLLMRGCLPTTVRCPNIRISYKTSRCYPKFVKRPTNKGANWCNSQSWFMVPLQAGCNYTIDSKGHFNELRNPFCFFVYLPYLSS